MNKKFSTLLASALLVGSVTASAAGIPVNKVTKIEQLTTGSRYYVLSTAQVTTTAPLTDAGVVVSMEGDAVKAAQSVGAGLNAISKELWSMKVTAVAGSNRFIFTNKSEGLTLSFDPAKAVALTATATAALPAVIPASAYEMTGADTEWTWVTNANATAELANVKELVSAFRTDSTMALAKDANGKVFAYKYANANTATIANQIKVQAVQPSSVVLSAADLNVLGEGADKYFTMDAGKANLIGNVFKGVKLQAQNVVATNIATQPEYFNYAANVVGGLAATTTGYVVLNKLNAEGKPSFTFAHVDTAFHIGSAVNENQWYKFATATGKVTIDEDNDDAIVTLDSLAKKGGLAQEAFEFKFERNLFTDKVLVSVQKEALKEKGPKLVAVFGKETFWSADQTDAKKSTYLNLSAIKLTADTEVFTLYEADKDVNIAFSVSSEPADETLTSEADGVYYIKNKKGQYLAVPIHNTTDEYPNPNMTISPEWVTVNASEQEVAHMPAYQWVVLKDKTYSDRAKEISPLTITNREFAKWTKAKGVQLKSNDGAAYKYVSTWTLGVKNTDSIEFKPVPATALSDTLLGYKNFEKDSLLVNRYTFNYMHAYAENKYIAKSTKDSLATVLDDVLPFVVEQAGDIEDYGYNVKEAGTRIAGLKQLRRQAYSLHTPSVKGKAYLNSNSESKYMLSTYVFAQPFYFKENNDQTANKHYHALVARHIYGAIINGEKVEYYGYSKAGVTDDDLSATLKDQNMQETRTSAFNIAKYDAPLYRRFNSLALEGNAGDAADTLRFVEKYRKEYLQIENNKNFMVKGIDFLGVYTADKADGGLSFIVDTAFVNRWAGDIKPQYLISIDRKDQVSEPGKMCAVCQAIVDAGGARPTGCVHDATGIAPFQLGKYLVNFADSVKLSTKADDYKWKGYTRAGFVKAAHMGDSLYILKNQFADVTVATFDTAAIHKAVKDGKYDKANICNLQKDDHKNVTWSMRYIDPVKAAEETEAARSFLFESDGTLDIAPVVGNWLKMQNGCLVISGSNGSTSSFDVLTQDDDALVFNAEYTADDEIATDNETITTSEFSVIGGQGQVTIANAEGKKVIISNLLGQVVANTVITSDNATIAVPAGVVVVAVEGEEAVKAIVK